MAATLKISIGSYSDKGVKPDNEDFFGALIPDDSRCLMLKGIAVAIADGMSGSGAGKQASHSCVVGFLEDYYSAPDSWSVVQAGRKILAATNSWLYSQGQRHSAVKALVSTLSVLVLKSNTAHIFHVGDSRIYRLRGKHLEQLTQDHRIWLSDDRNYLNRAMGIEPFLQVDYKTVPMQQGDVFILTTDGVHDYLDDKELQSCFSDGSDLETAAKNMVEEALRNASLDNLTCQLIRVDELPCLQEDEVLRRHENMPFPPPLEPGMILDHYRIESEVHASKRTQIYLAYDSLQRHRVVLKTPSVLYEDDTHYIEHFLHEEWAGKRIRHDNVVKVLEPDRDKSCLYYVTEYIDGLTLREWMARHPKPEIGQVRPIVEQIAKGLRAFHRMEMLHQDLKPENIMIDRNGKVRIIDFGSVKIAGIAEITAHGSDRHEGVPGTLNYTAPEFLLGLRGSVKSDLFSLGVICYELFNGALPFGRDMPERPDRRQLNKLKYVPSILHNEMVPIWIDGALKKATALSPQLRYDELSEFLYDLTVPNPKFFSAEAQLPLLERNPLLVWKGLTGLLLLTNLILLYWLNR